MNTEMTQEQVVLVDENNLEVGTMEKMAAHHEGALHRAFSVFVFNSQDELLLQRRALHKYHSGGLWTNTCCSHPRPGEALEDAVHRRLVEEMGFDCETRHAFSFLYHQKVGELIEHELDHVFIGQFNGIPQINPEEVAAWKAVKMTDLLADMKNNPDDYTVWFRLCIDLVEKQRQAGFENPAGVDLPIQYIG